LAGSFLSDNLYIAEGDCLRKLVGDGDVRKVHGEMCLLETPFSFGLTTAPTHMKMSELAEYLPFLWKADTSAQKLCWLLRGRVMEEVRKYRGRYIFVSVVSVTLRKGRLVEAQKEGIQ
jgi:hypothetical protein